MQVELVKMPYWIRSVGFRLIVVFEGRDAAGKGGHDQARHRAPQPARLQRGGPGHPLRPRARPVVLTALCAALPRHRGEIVIFDRSCYNRAGVERVMGFCTHREVQQFPRSCPGFERMVVDSGIMLLKNWFSVSDEEQGARFRSRLEDPTRRWKLSPMDVEARNHGVEFSEAKDEMFAHTNIPEAPWFRVEADDKRRAGLNTIRHLLAKVPYEDVTPPAIDPLDRSAAPPQRQTRAEAAQERAVPRAERSRSEAGRRPDT